MLQKSFRKFSMTMVVMLIVLTSISSVSAQSSVSVESLFVDWTGATTEPRHTAEDADATYLFPNPALVDFDADLFRDTAIFLYSANETAQAHLHNISGGNSGNCGVYLSAYVLYTSAPVFQNVPSGYDSAIARYESAVSTFITKNEPLAIWCANPNNFSSFSWSLAFQGTNSTRDIIEPLARDLVNLLGAPEGAIGGVIAPSAPEQPAPMPEPEAPAPAPEPEAEAEAPAPEAEAPAPAPEPEAPAPAPEPEAEAPQQGSIITDATVDETVDRLYINWTGPRASARVQLDLGDDGVNQQINALLAPAMTPFNDADFYVSQLFTTSSMLLMAVSTADFDCDFFAASYILASLSPVFTDVPAEWQGLVDIYERGVKTALDAGRELMQICLVGGNPAGKIEPTINSIINAIQIIEPALTETTNRLGDRIQIN